MVLFPSLARGEACARPADRFKRMVAIGVAAAVVTKVPGLSYSRLEYFPPPLRERTLEWTLSHMKDCRGPKHGFSSVSLGWFSVSPTIAGKAAQETSNRFVDAQSIVIEAPVQK